MQLLPAKLFLTDVILFVKSSLCLLGNALFFITIQEKDGRIQDKLSYIFGTYPGVFQLLSIILLLY